MVSPKLSRALLLRAEAYRLCGNDVAARRDLQRAIRTDPSQAWPYLFLGSLLLAKDCTKVINPCTHCAHGALLLCVQPAASASLAAVTVTAGVVPQAGVLSATRPCGVAACLLPSHRRP